MTNIIVTNDQRCPVGPIYIREGSVVKNPETKIKSCIVIDLIKKYEEMNHVQEQRAN